MPENVYFPEVECEVQEGGLYPDGIAASVRDVNGRTQHVQLSRGIVNRYGTRDYLPVGFVEIDRQGRRVLIELPAEADSGTNRMWVEFDALRHEAASNAGVSV